MLTAKRSACRWWTTSLAALSLMWAQAAWCAPPPGGGSVLRPEVASSGPGNLRPDPPASAGSVRIPFPSPYLETARSPVPPGRRRPVSRGRQTPEASGRSKKWLLIGIGAAGALAAAILLTRDDAPAAPMITVGDPTVGGPE